MTFDRADGTSSTRREVVSLRGAVKRFSGTTALAGASLTVHEGESVGLLGRNGAGKSTIVRTLTGLHGLDEGTLEINGGPAPALGDRRAWLDAISCVYQHRTLVPDLSVAENMFLGAYGPRGATINRRAQLAAATAHLEAWEVDVDPRQPLSALSIGDAQMIEIVRALVRGTRMIILDEPTAQLVSSEIDVLLARVNQLRAKGVSFLYISHHLDEVPQVCDSLVVLRNGRDVLTGKVAETDMSQVVSAMVGGGSAGKLLLAEERIHRNPIDLASSPVLDAVGVRIAGVEDPLTLQVRAGEVVGLAGHQGSGVRQIALTLAGHARLVAGTFTVGGRPCGGSRWNSEAALKAGVAFVPEDRIASGLVPGMTIEDNATLPVLKEISGPLGIHFGERRRRAESARASLDIACSSVGQPVAELSGGNQQKVLIGAALSAQPAVLVLVHPTAGVDIASKAKIMSVVEKHREEGLAVLVVSDEPEELGFCDRVQIWTRGRLIEEGTGYSSDDLVAGMEGTGNVGEKRE